MLAELSTIFIGVPFPLDLRRRPFLSTPAQGSGAYLGVCANQEGRTACRYKHLLPQKAAIVFDGLNVGLGRPAWSPATTATR